MIQIQHSRVSKDGRLYRWRFPLPRTHTGVLQGNGVLGAMIWGEGPILRITLNRADFWDHRGGMPWTEKVSYTALRRSLEAGDEEDLRRRFETGEARTGEPPRPSRLPLGRVELDFGPGATLLDAALDLSDGTVTVRIDKAGGVHAVRIALPMDRPGLLVQCAQGLSPFEVRSVTAWELQPEGFRAIGFEPPERLHGDGLQGWVQPRPADPPVCVGHRQAGDLWAAAVTYGGDPGAARAAAKREVDRLLAAGFAGVQGAAAAWWGEFWRDAPTIEIPNPHLEFLYRYGMYKFAGLTHPEGVPGTLQGPWVEEYKFPPWSSDYHFNINVQECYWPAYRGNRLAHLLPLFDMVLSWEPLLRENARLFLGIEDGIMLPHAVDDRGTCMGGFWSGAVDHGCTAWVAHMMAEYVRYSGDLAFLREKAYPFMKGAMRVYEEMLEQEGERWVLPVSVSPEYRGNRLDAWGRNASFQLACIHALLEALFEAAELLGEPPKPVWRAIQAGLPKACVMGERPEIYLWEGTPLEESHRHHSHLAGIYPFDVIDVDDPAWRPIVQRTVRRWIAEGMGLWSGWCMPWAAILHTRLGHAETAELLLDTWQRVFTNEGQGTLHDAHFPGFSLMGSTPLAAPNRAQERMQMDAAMGAVGAILEMLLHSRRGVHYLFWGAPAHWERVAFDGIRAAGGFLVSAERVGGEVTEVRITSERGGRFRLADPWGDGVLEVDLGAGEGRVLRPPGGGLRAG
ncbi:MAG TPA: hypothetical protein VF234_09015 [Limnochordia bacterium]